MTYQEKVPLDRDADAELVLDVATSTGASVPCWVHTSYIVAPVTAFQENATLADSSEAPLAGLTSTGFSVAHVMAGVTVMVRVSTTRQLAVCTSTDTVTVGPAPAVKPMPSVP